MTDFRDELKKAVAYQHHGFSPIGAAHFNEPTPKLIFNTLIRPWLKAFHPLSAHQWQGTIETAVYRTIQNWRR